MLGTSPRLILVAKQDIEPGTELLYDYGDWYVIFYFMKRILVFTCPQLPAFRIRYFFRVPNRLNMAPHT